MTPHWGNTILFHSSQQLPRLCLGSLKGFQADRVPFKGPRLASCVASASTEIQGHRQVCRARCGGPRTPSPTTDANLDCAFVENALFLHRSLILKSRQTIIELVTRPDRDQFANMVRRCNAAGVNVIADSVINHMR